MNEAVACNVKSKNPQATGQLPEPDCCKIPFLCLVGRRRSRAPLEGPSKPKPALREAPCARAGSQSPSPHCFTHHDHFLPLPLVYLPRLSRLHSSRSNKQQQAATQPASQARCDAPSSECTKQQQATKQPRKHLPRHLQQEVQSRRLHVEKDPEEPKNNPIRPKSSLAPHNMIMIMDNETPSFFFYAPNDKQSQQIKRSST